ncbi:MAG: hypothetical protein CSA23_02985 [Deltaproteobacteria bacterium]|nr:MAG: hypothetical protein CSA23_02985 [Deltaproteobacteria bacterium]
MGEKINDLAEFNISEMGITVELNRPVFEDESSIVHVQTKAFRFECSFEDFFLLASAFLVAEKNLKIIKAMK